MIETRYENLNEYIQSIVDESKSLNDYAEIISQLEDYKSIHYLYYIYPIKNEIIEFWKNFIIEKGQLIKDKLNFRSYGTSNIYQKIYKLGNKFFILDIVENNSLFNTEVGLVHRHRLWSYFSINEVFEHKLSKIIYTYNPPINYKFMNEPQTLAATHITKSNTKYFTIMIDVSEDTLTELLKNNQLSITSKYREDINLNTCIITADEQVWDYYFEKYCPKYYHKDFNILFKTKIQYCKYEESETGIYPKHSDVYWNTINKSEIKEEFQQIAENIYDNYEYSFNWIESTYHIPYKDYIEDEFWRYLDNKEKYDKTEYLKNMSVSLCSNFSYNITHPYFDLENNLNKAESWIKSNDLQWFKHVKL
jgi:hypothetical protein